MPPEPPRERLESDPMRVLGPMYDNLFTLYESQLHQIVDLKERIVSLSEQLQRCEEEKQEVQHQRQVEAGNAAEARDNATTSPEIIDDFITQVELLTKDGEDKDLQIGIMQSKIEDLERKSREEGGYKSSGCDENFGVDISVPDGDKELDINNDDEVETSDDKQKHDTEEIQEENEKGNGDEVLSPVNDNAPGPQTPADPDPNDTNLRERLSGVTKLLDATSHKLQQCGEERRKWEDKSKTQTEIIMSLRARLIECEREGTAKCKGKCEKLRERLCRVAEAVEEHGEAARVVVRDAMEGVEGLEW